MNLTEMKSTWAVLTIFLAVASGYWWYTNVSASAQVENEPLSLMEGESTETVNSLPVLSEISALETDSGEAESGPEFKTIVEVPDYRPTSSSLEKFDDEIQQATAQKIERALAGDIDEAVDVGKFNMYCETRFNKVRDVERRIGWMSRRSNRFPANMSVTSGGFQSFATIDDYETYLLSQLDECDASRELFDDELRERLVRLAESGDAVARYLYAMWLPDGGLTEHENIVKRLEYESRALEFTWQNISEHHALGLLAFGQSYLNSRPGFFTPSDSSTGRIFLMAARNCGIESPWLISELLSIGSRWDARRRQEYIARLEITAMDMSRVFCS